MHFLRKHPVFLVSTALFVLIICTVGYFVWHTMNPANVSNPDVEFSSSDTSQESQPPQNTLERKQLSSWPIYGRTANRTHELQNAQKLTPPFQIRWKSRQHVLLEFTPVLCQRTLYLMKNNGALYAINADTGKTLWKRKLGVLAASSPACEKNTVYTTLLKYRQNQSQGRIVALQTKTGKVKWSRQLPSRSESSPVIANQKVFFGSENGTVYALRTTTGAKVWTFKASRAVKGAPAIDHDRVFFGDYAGRLYALQLDSGRKLWQSSGTVDLLGGSFYSTPAVAYKRVYIGNTNGFVYSFATRNGKLAWRTRLKGYVYSSPSVATIDGSQPTVFVGSYGGDFAALDARSGRVRWKRSIGSKISGSATVLGKLVFFAVLGRTEILALDTKTGHTRWQTNRGAFNAVISDGKWIYLNGYESIYAFEAKQKHPPHKSITSTAQEYQRQLKRFLLVQSKRCGYEKSTQQVPHLLQPQALQPGGLACLPHQKQ